MARQTLKLLYPAAGPAPSKARARSCSPVFYWLVVAVAVTPASVVTWTSLGPGGKSVILSTVLS